MARSSSGRPGTAAVLLHLLQAAEWLQLFRLLIVFTKIIIIIILYYYFYVLLESRWIEAGCSKHPEA